MPVMIDDERYAEISAALEGCGEVSVSFIQICFGTGMGAAVAIMQRMSEDGLLSERDMGEEERRSAESRRQALLCKAMEKRPSLLEFISEQTPELCLAAVKSDGMTLRFVRKQTKEICDAAVASNPEAAQFIGRPYEDDAEADEI